jgi:hypothetical protein
MHVASQIPTDPGARSKLSGKGGKPMMDVWMVMGTIVFFAVSIGYTHGCEHLR